MIRALLVALVLLLGLPSLAGALSVNEVAREVRCPTCNTSLDLSNAPVAVNMKQYIADRIERGWTKEEIVDGLVAQFGESVLTTPPKSGFDLIAWLVPGLAVTLGLLAIPVAMRAWAKRARAAPARDVPPPSPEEARRLDEELGRLGGP